MIQLVSDVGGLIMLEEMNAVQKGSSSNTCILSTAFNRFWTYR